MTDMFRNFGAVSVSGKTMFKLLKNGYSTLLYPGGAREALHRKVWHFVRGSRLKYQSVQG